ncbi:MAG TPA: ATP-binding protein [Thermoanaerobaculia bacterium]|jgi:serine/threonine-protein kinase RsbW|nr:ATP-binding protein [Thermoanaerobaculia bacterium]
MTAIENTFTLDVPSSTANLAIIRDFVTRIAAQAGLNEVEVGQLELAVDEACANVIEHAYGDDKTKQVMIRAVFDEDTLRIHVIDTGQGFDPTQIPQQDLKDLIAKRKTGGLGMRLIKTLMDEVTYEIEPGRKNELRMVKKLRK